VPLWLCAFEILSVLFNDHKGLFDGVKIWRIWRQAQQGLACTFQQRLNFFLL